MSDPALEPDFRPCVGIMVLNQNGHVWMGRRHDNSGKYDKGELWQMPQGGIDEGEEPIEAALRELFEETSMRNVEVVQESQGWFKYELPADIAKTGWRSRYRGQIQKWFAVIFNGNDDEINILAPGNGDKPEFDRWEWMPMEKLASTVITFKRDVYRQVVEEFSDLSGQN